MFELSSLTPEEIQTLILYILIIFCFILMFFTITFIFILVKLMKIEKHIDDIFLTQHNQNAEIIHNRKQIKELKNKKE